MRTGPTNLITDVAGLRVGEAHDLNLASGVTVIVFDEPAVASVDVRGGAPGTRETDLLAPERTVPAIDAVFLFGGSAFGLDAGAGVMAALAEQGRGFAVGPARVPIVPGAILFDLLNGGNKAWGRYPPYRDMAYSATQGAGRALDLGSVGAGTGATTATLKGGLGSASQRVGAYTVGAIVAVNALGSACVGETAHFWAACEEIGNEFGGLGAASAQELEAPRAYKGKRAENTTIALVATDAALTKTQARHVAAMAQGGLAIALRPVHTPLDGDTVFSASTGLVPLEDPIGDLIEIGSAASRVLARAVARAIYHAAPVPGVAQPTWRDRFGAPGG